MKTKIIIITFLVITSSLTAWGQTLIETTGKPVQNIPVLEQRKAVTYYQPINVNLDVLKDGQVKISFWGLNETVYQTNLNVRSFKNFSWFGSSNDMTTSVILTVAENDIQGIITHKTEVYRIETVENIYYITKIDHSKYPSEECGNSLRNDNSNDINNQDNTEDINHQQKMITGEPFTCRLRLLVLYTPAAKNAVSNISNTIQLAVDELKQSFFNSNVNREIELVYVGETNYTESGLSYSASDNDLTRFSGNSDGYMDEVHNLRSKHQADICVLVSDDQSLCGIARGIKVSSPYAFCLVNYDCATGYYSFAHEIAHLIGCQHHQSDPVHSGASSAYPYAHGYKSPNNDWRTIMAYNCSGGCTRLLYWSNPNITYNYLPMGTNSTNNNAKMLNEKIPNAMSYLQPANTVTVQSADIVASKEGDIIAKNNVETSGNITIQSGQSYSFRSVGSIVLEPGFTAQVGSNFVAEIVEVDDCGQPDGENSDYGIASDLPDYVSKKSEEIISSFIVYPNPTHSLITVSIEAKNKGDVALIISDYTGKTAIKLGKYPVINGNFSKEFNLSDLANGVYFIFLTVDNQNILSQKIIKNK